MWIKSRGEQKLSTYIVDYQQKLLITFLWVKFTVRQAKSTTKSVDLHKRK